jgi:hypothetical protein
MKWKLFWRNPVLFQNLHAGCVKIYGKKEPKGGSQVSVPRSEPNICQFRYVIRFGAGAWTAETGEASSGQEQR